MGNERLTVHFNSCSFVTLNIASKVKLWLILLDLLSSRSCPPRQQSRTADSSRLRWFKPDEPCEQRPPALMVQDQEAQVLERFIACSEVHSVGMVSVTSGGSPRLCRRWLSATRVYPSGGGNLRRTSLCLDPLCLFTTWTSIS